MMTGSENEISALHRLCSHQTQISIIGVFLENPYSSFNKSDIKEATGISRPTIREHIQPFIDMQIIEPVSTYDYVLNKKHELSIPLYMLYHYDPADS